MNWLKQAVTRGKIFDDLAEEIRLHLEERTERLIEDGMDRKEAESQAKREFGNETLIEERSREVWQWPMLESILSDVKFAQRQLWKSPGFTLYCHCDACSRHQHKRSHFRVCGCGPTETTTIYKPQRTDVCERKQR
jgi:hypothetical protein